MEKLDNGEALELADPSLGAGPVTGVSVARTAESEGDRTPVTAISSKLYRWGCVRRCLPPAYAEELYHVLRLTGPLLVSRIMNFLLMFVNSIFCGHIGNSELAGYALASAVINITTTATGFGLSLACDTLISQTFGSKNLKRVGVILQRSSLILLVFCLPCWGLLINSQNLLLILHQKDEVARIAHLYVMAYLPAVPAMFLHILQVAYLQNQGIILPQLYTAVAANIFNLAANYILIFSLELGVTGSAIANSLGQIVICLLLYGYIRWKKLHQQTWGGWSTDCLQEWGSYMKLAIPSAFMICFEWWIWEIGGFLAGLLGEVDLAAQHLLVEIGAITFMLRLCDQAQSLFLLLPEGNLLKSEAKFPLGVHAAACVRVGNALGAGNTSRAIVTCKVSMVLSGLLAVCQGILIMSYKSVVGYIFTSDENIVAMVSENLTLYAFLQFFDAILCVCSGIVVGCGMQKIAALANLVCYYCIGLPVGISLMFAAELRILGFWLGIFTCVFFQTGFFVLLIFKLNWKKITQRAQLRAGKKVVVIPRRPASILLNEPMVPEISDCPHTVQFNGEEVPKVDGYSSVNTQDQELKEGHEANDTNAGGAEKDAELSKKSSNTKTNPARLLSVTELILRRGLTLFVSVLILAIGLAFRLTFPAPEASTQSRANFTLNWANDSTPTLLSPLDPTTDPSTVFDL